MAGLKMDTDGFKRIALYKDLTWAMSTLSGEAFMEILAMTFPELLGGSFSVTKDLVKREIVYAYSQK